MRNGTKICLILGCIFTFTGFVTAASAFAFGGARQLPREWRSEIDRVFDKYDYDYDYEYDYDDDYVYEESVIEQTVVYSADGLDFWESYGQGITAIDLNIGLGDINIIIGEEFSVNAVEMSSNFKCYEKNGKLVIEDKWKYQDNWNNGNDYNSVIDITVPEGVTLKELDLNTGLGDIMVYEISVKDLEIDTSLGDIHVEQVTFDDADVYSSLGDVYIMLNGSQTDYNYDLATSLGVVYVNGEGYENLTSGSYKKNNKTKKDLEVESSLGDIIVEFH